MIIMASSRGMPGMEYIPKLNEVEGVEGGAPPHPPIWQEHPMRSDQEKAT